MITIVTESKLKSSELHDLEYFRNKYKIDDVIFDSPYIELLGQNYEFLIRNSHLVDLDKKYMKRPEYLSYDIYGTTSLWFMLLYVNKCFTAEDFKQDKVYIPTRAAVNHVLKDYKLGEIKEV